MDGSTERVTEDQHLLGRHDRGERSVVVPHFVVAPDAQTANEAQEAGTTVGLEVEFDNAAVQVAGYAEVPAAAKITVGYQTLAANSSGKVAANANGREYLVVDADATRVGIIL